MLTTTEQDILQEEKTTLGNKELSLTVSEEKVLKVLDKYILEYGYPPSIRELAEMARYKSTSSIHSLLTSLEKKGYIKRGANSSRAIRIIKRV